ncbi:heme-binding domain-containing protein [Flavobacterium gawalongense]|uniref:Cytochrome C n=1 Tax=Flavobacterium gawalongense TaxID=2594432 RepID=A0A553BEG7_9FLAO|nr:heme-binding domain-containing protein [Flavobacterium gawalongense]TRW98964.1 cytochrome C [Flavobacterium gawalongense]TRX03532.1 cytochrome C [Flavobacterium gawalongense]TRX06637.1 cytochrome C [Flavobacterium gawalongense]TRX08535.1 cytochrome C [Flavobacterium gawalongense]TRX24863.1 cytochrome C [Flavobacterium gawalongense]
MKKIIKKILIIGFVIFLLMQLYQPARNESYEQELIANFTKMYDVPKNVETILQTSCFDCHSNNTNYPLYSYIQPARFFMEEHIKDGKKDLNFNEFGKYSKRKQENKLEAIIKQIKSDEMPLASYTLLHKNAIVTPAQKEEVIDWFNKTEDSLSSKY